MRLFKSSLFLHIFKTVVIDFAMSPDNRPSAIGMNKLIVVGTALTPEPVSLEILDDRSAFNHFLAPLL